MARAALIRILPHPTASSQQLHDTNYFMINTQQRRPPLLLTLTHTHTVAVYYEVLRRRYL